MMSFVRWNPKQIERSQFTHFVADNVHRNIWTVNGHKTFHVMVLISVSHLGHQLRIPGCKARISMREACKQVSSWLSHRPSSKQLGQGLAWCHCYLGYPSLDSTLRGHLDCQVLRAPRYLNPALGLAICRAAVKATILWHVEYWCCRFWTSTRQKWLVSACQVCVRFHQQTGIIAAPTKRIHYTDQPLYSKAINIVLADGLNTVVRLGGFHTLLNFMGAVAHMGHVCYAWLKAGKCTGMYIWQEHCWTQHDWQKCRRTFADPQCSSANVVYNTHLVMHNATYHTL